MNANTRVLCLCHTYIDTYVTCGELADR
eukprot:SAG25_NODE_8634_length_411_cov_1.342949_1_plen_27_part_01